MSVYDEVEEIEMHAFNRGRSDALEEVVLWLEAMVVDWEHIEPAEQALRSALETFRRWKTGKL